MKEDELKDSHLRSLTLHRKVMVEHDFGLKYGVQITCEVVLKSNVDDHLAAPHDPTQILLSSSSLFPSII
jgi:hypothetical protein